MSETEPIPVRIVKDDDRSRAVRLYVLYLIIVLLWMLYSDQRLRVNIIEYTKWGVAWAVHFVRRHYKKARRKAAVTMMPRLSSESVAQAVDQFYSSPTSDHLPVQEAVWKSAANGE